MPVNSFQQELANALISMGAFAGKSWFLIGMALCGGLAVLALVPLLATGRLSKSMERPVAKVFFSDGVFLGLSMFTLVVLRLPGITFQEVNPDESCLILGARTVLQDPRYWISIEGQSLGPISTFSVALPAMFGAPIDYTTIKLVGLGTWCAVWAMMFFGLRRLYSAKLARLFVLPLVVMLATVTFWDYVAYNGETPSTLLLALAFVLHAPLLKRPDRWHPGCAFFLGFALALIPFAKSQVGPLAFAWGVMACVLAFKENPRRVIPLVLGAATPVALLVVYLVTSGATYDFWQSYILNNLLYASVGWNASQADTSLLMNFLTSPSYLLTPRESRWFFSLCGAACLLTVGWSLASTPMRRRMLSRDVMLGIVLCAAALICILMPKNNWTHYLVMLFVPVVMLTAAVSAKVFEALGEHETKRRDGCRESEMRGRISRVWMLGAAFALVGGLIPAGYNMLKGNPALHQIVESRTKGNTPDTIVAAILRHAAPGDAVAMWGVRFQEICQAGVWLGNREAQIERALYPSRQQDYYLRRWASDVIARKPPILIDSCTGEWFGRFRLANFPREEAIVLERYRLVEEIEGFHIYRIKDEVVSAQVE